MSLGMEALSSEGGGSEEDVDAGEFGRKFAASMAA